MDMANELDALADQREAEAARLRAAAAVLRGDQNQPGPHMRMAEPSALAVYHQRSYVTEAEYLQVLSAFGPSYEWTAESLATELGKAGKAVASIDAVRTALVRLYKKGTLIRAGHGRYKLAQLAATSGGTAP